MSRFESPTEFEEATLDYRDSRLVVRARARPRLQTIPVCIFQPKLLSNVTAREVYSVQRESIRTRRTECMPNPESQEQKGDGLDKVPLVAADRGKISLWADVPV